MKLVETLVTVPTCGPPRLSMILPDRKTVKCEEPYEDCFIQMYEHEFLTDLYKFELTNFDVILGMDWLAKYQAQIDCLK